MFTISEEVRQQLKGLNNKELLEKYKEALWTNVYTSLEQAYEEASESYNNNAENDTSFVDFIDVLTSYFQQNLTEEVMQKVFEIDRSDINSEEEPVTLEVIDELAQQLKEED